MGDLAMTFILRRRGGSAKRSVSATVNGCRGVWTSAAVRGKRQIWASAIHKAVLTGGSLRPHIGYFDIVDEICHIVPIPPWSWRDIFWSLAGEATSLVSADVIEAVGPNGFLVNTVRPDGRSDSFGLRWRRAG